MKILPSPNTMPTELEDRCWREARGGDTVVQLSLDVSDFASGFVDREAGSKDWRDKFALRR